MLGVHSPEPTSLAVKVRKAISASMSCTTGLATVRASGWVPNGTALRTVTRERVTTVDTTGTGHGPRHPGRAPAASPDRCTSRGSRLHDCTTGNRKRNAWNGTRRSSVPIDDRPPATTPIFDPDPGGYTPRRAHEAAKRSPQTHMVCPGTMRSMVILPRGPSTAICISPPFRCPCVIMPMDAGRWILCGLYC